MKLFLDHFRFSKIPGWSTNSQSCDANFDHVDNPRGSTSISFLHENIHATRVVALSAEEMGIIEKLNSERLTVRSRDYQGKRVNPP